MREEYITFEKTQDGLFRIHVWDKDAMMAANIANGLMDYIEQVNSHLQIEYNKHSLEQIAHQIGNKLNTYKNLSDSASRITNESENLYIKHRLNNIMEDIAQLEKIKTQFETTLQFQQPSLRVVDKAIPNDKHVKPKRIFEFISTMLISIVCLIFLILMIESLTAAFKNYE
jgi:hypothetical protein